MSWLFPLAVNISRIASIMLAIGSTLNRRNVDKRFPRSSVYIYEGPSPRLVVDSFVRFEQLCHGLVKHSVSVPPFHGCVCVWLYVAAHQGRIGIGAFQALGSRMGMFQALVRLLGLVLGLVVCACFSAVSVI